MPRFVVAEFERYLKCGILAHGFARVRCTSCGDELLVAFSCKSRGVCPSCTTRRMQGTATHLIDRVLPHVPLRQWVLSLPRGALFLLARDPAPDGLAASQAESVSALRGKPADAQPKRLAAYHQGFSLHATNASDKGDDERGGGCHC